MARVQGILVKGGGALEQPLVWAILGHGASWSLVPGPWKGAGEIRLGTGHVLRSECGGESRHFFWLLTFSGHIIRLTHVSPFSSLSQPSTTYLSFSIFRSLTYTKQTRRMFHGRHPMVPNPLPTPSRHLPATSYGAIPGTTSSQAW